MRLSRTAAASALFLWVILLHLPLATFQAVPLSDDIFTSDLLDGEWPARVAMGRQFARGEGSGWLPGIYGGYPAIGGGAAADPITLFCFSIFPPAVALDLFVLITLLLAGFGTYRVARALGATRVGALVAGGVFVQCGVMVSQIRHLGFLAAVAWFPWALWALIRFCKTRGVRPLALFALFFGLQWLSGFPQTAYACALVYGAVALTLTRDWKLLAGALLACGVAALIGAAQLLPQLELASLSDRAGGVSEKFAVHFAYLPRNVLQFLWPYVYGDVSDRTYRGASIFWEDFGYAGVTTLVLAGIGVFRRERNTWLLVGIAAVAFLFVLGPATPVFPLAFRFVPLMSTFRLPTRFLFLVDFALALLAALGASKLGNSRWSLLALLCLADVGWFNSRQNAADSASEWTTPPATVQLFDTTAPFRVLTPGWTLIHQNAFVAARGWSGDLTPYHQMRAFLQPDLNLQFDIATGDGYAGIAPRWSIDVWGDHNRPGLLTQLYRPVSKGFAFTPAFFKLVGMENVRYLITPQPLRAPGVREVGSAGPAHVSELESWLPRARLVPRFTVVEDRAALQRMASADFEPRTEVLLDRPLGSGTGSGSAAIVEARSDRLTIETTADVPSTLVLADTWYPGWEATVDGAPVEIARAYVSQRAVAVPAGKHAVRFEFHSKPARRGLLLSLAGALLVAVALWRARAA